MFATTTQPQQRALGIDPGLVRTGWAVLEPVGLRARVLGHGVICPPTDAPLPARLAHGARALRLAGLDPPKPMRLDETDAIALALAALYQTTHPLARIAR